MDVNRFLRITKSMHYMIKRKKFPNDF